MFDYSILKERFWGTADSHELFSRWDEVMTGISLDDIMNDVLFDEELFIGYFKKYGNATDEVIAEFIKEKSEFLKDKDAIVLLYYLSKLENYQEHYFALSTGLLNKTIPKFNIFFLLLALAKIPETLRYYAEKNIPEQIQIDTLSDLFLSRMSELREKRGLLGIDANSRNWLENHFAHKLYQVGRLQYQFPHKYMGPPVFKNKRTGGKIILSKPGIRYNNVGLIDGIEGVWDEDNSWVSGYIENELNVTGHQISATGYAEKTRTRLDLSDWEKVIDTGDAVLNIHIPATGPLKSDITQDSIARAKVFVKECFPEYDFKGMVCYSWLIAPEFLEILKPTSNVRLFQKLGRVFPWTGCNAFNSRVFSLEAVEAGDINVDTPSNSMQHAFADFINSGGILHNGGFIIL